MIRAGSVFALLAVLAGCNDPAREHGADSGAGVQAALPGPAATGGNSVTGMPDQPGPNPSPDDLKHSDSPVATADPVPSLAAGTATAPAAATLEPGAAVDPQLPLPVEPTAGEAAAVVRDYYVAISTGRLDQAYGLWADDGRASGQSPRQFAGGFADVESVSVDVLEPGRVEPAAGSRYVEVPVAVTAVHRDGSRHRYVGAYTLRRSVVDGASDAQRAWRLHSADIREVQL